MMSASSAALEAGEEAVGFAEVGAAADLAGGVVLPQAHKARVAQTETIFLMPGKWEAIIFAASRN